MRPARLALLVVVTAGVGGCARIIGAQFDDARLAPPAGDDAGAEASVNGGDDAGIEGGGFDPRDLGPLQLWLSADQGIELTSASPPDDAGDDAAADGAATIDAAPPLANAVTAWHDRAQSRVLAAWAPGSEPLLLANAVAGKPVLSFAPARQSCLHTAWEVAPPPSATVLVVVHGPSPVSAFRLAPDFVSGGGLSGLLIVPWSKAAPPPDDGGVRFLAFASTPEHGSAQARFDYTPGEWQVLSTRMLPGVVGGFVTYRNGAELERATLDGPATPSSTDVWTGCHPASAEYADGEIAEILYYAVALTDAQRERAEHYLGDRWAITLP